MRNFRSRRRSLRRLRCIEDSFPEFRIEFSDFLESSVDLGFQLGIFGFEPLGIKVEELIEPFSLGRFPLKTVQFLEKAVEHLIPKPGYEMEIIPTDGAKDL